MFKSIIEHDLIHTPLPLNTRVFACMQHAHGAPLEYPLKNKALIGVICDIKNKNLIIVSPYCTSGLSALQ